VRADDLYACATVDAGAELAVQVLNTQNEAVTYALQIGNKHAEIEIPANAVQTVTVRLESFSD
jgi:stringent starvation protein B